MSVIIKDIYCNDPEDPDILDYFKFTIDINDVRVKLNIEARYIPTAEWIKLCGAFNTNLWHCVCDKDNILIIGVNRYRAQFNLSCSYSSNNNDIPLSFPVYDFKNEFIRIRDLMIERDKRKEKEREERNETRKRQRVAQGLPAEETQAERNAFRTNFIAAILNSEYAEAFISLQQI